MKREGESSFNLANISQTRCTFLTKNPLGLLARFAGAGSPVAQVVTSPGLRVLNAAVQAIEDPTKGAKAMEIISNGVVRAIEGFGSQPTEVVRTPEPETEKQEFITPQSSLDLRQAVGFLERVTIDGSNSNNITKIAVSIAESDGDVLSQLTSVQKARLGGRNIKRIYRAGGNFEEAQRIMDSSLWPTFGDRAEHAKYLAKRESPAAGSLLESLKDEYDRRIPDARLTQSELLDVGLANFYAGTGDHGYWLNQADRAYTMNQDGKQENRKLLANAAIECGDVSRAWGYFNFDTAPKKDVLLTNISGSMELIQRCVRQAGSDPKTIYVLADRGSQFFGEFREKFGEYRDPHTYARYHRDGEEIFFQVMKDFSMSGGRYSPNNFMQSRHLVEHPGGHIPTIIANRIHWTRVLRMTGQDGDYRRTHSMLRDVWASTNDKTQPSLVVLEGYRKAIEMQTDVGDVAEARQTFALLETELTHTTTDVLLVKAEVMAMIGAAQKKLKLAVV